MKVEEIKLHFQKLNEQKIELALVDDLKQAEQMFKNAILKFGEAEKQYLQNKKDLKLASDKAYDVAIKYNSASNEIGVDAMKNIYYKTIDAYFQSPLVKGL